MASVKFTNIIFGYPYRPVYPVFRSTGPQRTTSITYPGKPQDTPPVAAYGLDSTVRDQKLKTIFEKLIAISFIVTACLLFLSAWSLMVWSIWKVLIDLIYIGSISEGLLNMIGVVVIAMAVIEVGRYIIEEEIYLSRTQDPLSQKEITGGVVKIFVIIIISVGLEGLVYLFKAGLKNISLLPYPAIIIFASVLALVGLGIYQKLTKTDPRSTAP